MKKSKGEFSVVDINAVRSRILVIRNQQVLLDRDVAALYGVETKEVNQAVRNNAMKFPHGYVMELDKSEVVALRSKILTLERTEGRGHYSKHGYKVFTEKGLYMLATILKRERAVRATSAIIPTDPIEPMWRSSSGGVRTHQSRRGELPLQLR